MKKDFYTNNAVVVLDDGDTYSGIEDAFVLVFKVPDDDIFEPYDGVIDCLDSDEEHENGLTPSEMVYEQISIEELIKVYMKHHKKSKE
jgi:hypothetical protein